MSSTLGPKPPADKPLLWNHTSRLPEEEDLLIVFEGLFSFCYVTQQPTSTKPPIPANDLPHCEIGVFNQDPRHRLVINIRGGTCDGNDYEYSMEQLRGLVDEVFKIEVEGPGASPDVAFYQLGAQFNRDNADHDFRWLVDVEGPDLYDVETPNKRPFYRPRLIVKNGTFFTQERTRSTFKFVNKNHPSSNDEPMIGSIAYSTAARIKLNAGQRAKFDFRDPDQRRVTCTFEPTGPPHSIVFTNLCRDGADVCPGADFDLHFSTFDPPTTRDPYGLTKVESHTASHSFGGMKTLPRIVLKPFGSDDAPCHAMGYGKSPGGTG